MKDKIDTKLERRQSKQKQKLKRALTEKTESFKNSYQLYNHTETHKKKKTHK
ncbi:MAG: hypothetical protein LBG45_05145 [Dysgonamonadaceae bacterium]|jgi:hypothetical protein|nr:hypothetical protein [Dysgonamonadaceae bacterium]